MKKAFLIVIIIALLLISASISCALQKYVITLEIYWLYTFVISLGCGLILAFVTKMLDFRELKDLIISSVKHIKK